MITRIALICLFVLTSIANAQVEPKMGQIWHKNPEGPFLTIEGEAGTWNTGVVPWDYYGMSLVWDGTQYCLYFTGMDEDGVRAIGMYTSNDPYGGWVEYEGNPILTAADVAWTSLEVCSPNVLLDGDTLKMWFVGLNDDGSRSLGYATSVDGINWTALPTSVLNPGPENAWDSAVVGW